MAIRMESSGHNLRGISWFLYWSQDQLKRLSVEYFWQCRRIGVLNSDQKEPKFIRARETVLLFSILLILYGREKWNQRTLKDLYLQVPILTLRLYVLNILHCIIRLQLTAIQLLNGRSEQHSSTQLIPISWFLYFHLTIRSATLFSVICAWLPVHCPTPHSPAADLRLQINCLHFLFPVHACKLQTIGGLDCSDESCDVQ